MVSSGSPVLGSSSLITLTLGWGFSPALESFVVLIRKVRLGDRYRVLMGEVGICGQTKLETKLEICLPIGNV